MNPGLVVKLRPSGPWRIGPDSGARNRVDVIYHSDSLYSAVTAAMSRLGWLEEWLDATARPGASAVSFGSCFPFQDDVAFVVPPRTVWPPVSQSARAARVRWKSARFVPLMVVQSVLAGKRLDENQWTVDGASDCLVPNGRPGPFRTAVRWSAAVDRLTGATDRHSTACLEFRAGAGLWTVVSFADDEAHTRWADKVKAAFRLLADTGFGGERSRGWGRSEAPEFIEGSLPDLILPVVARAEKPAKASVVAASPVALMVVDPEVVATEVAESATVAEPEVAAEPEVVAAPVDVVPVESEAVVEADAVLEPGVVEPVVAASVEVAPAGVPEAEPVAELVADVEPVAEAAPEAHSETVAEAAVAAEPVVVPEVVEPEVVEPAAEVKPDGPSAHPHWLLSVYTPSTADTVDWGRGNYSLLARGGRVDSPAGSGELKKQIQMVAEGSVLYAENAPRGSAANVAPDGFAHPVFRAGFALAIPLPEVR